jgi:hypothetical protein
MSHCWYSSAVRKKALAGTNLKGKSNCKPT